MPETQSLDETALKPTSTDVSDGSGDDDLNELLIYLMSAYATTAVLCVVGLTALLIVGYRHARALARRR